MEDKGQAMIEFECNCKVRVVHKEDLPDYPWVINVPTYCLDCHKTISIKDVSGD